MVRTPWYYIHLPHNRSQISRTTVLPPTAPRQPKARNTTRTSPPPYIRLPKPHPMSPNIHTRLHRRSLTNQHPPDIRPPRPIPPKPNISIRLPTFQQSNHPPGLRPF